MKGRSKKIGDRNKTHGTASGSLLPRHFTSQELRERFVDGSEDLMTVVDQEARFLYVNPATARFFGLSITECVGRLAFDFVHPDDRSATERAFHEWLHSTSAGQFTHENRQVGAAGAVREVSWSITPLFDGQHELAGFVSCARDLGERKRIERELRESEAFSRAILSSMLDPLISIDAFGTIQAASDSMERVFGWKPAELVGRNVKMLMPDPHRSLHDEYLAHYRATGKTWILGRTRQFEVVRKDGSMLVCDLSVARGNLPDGKEMFTGTFRDVTEKRRAEEALRESERRFHAIFDQAFQFVGLLDPRGMMLEVNQAALHATGATREDVVGKPFWKGRWWAFSPAVQRRIEEAVARAATGEFVRFEVEVHGQDGRMLDVDFSIKPVHNEQGEIVLLIPEGRDISQIKRAQKQETAMLRALASIGEQSAVLAHEIKNPITAVSLALCAVADQLGADQQLVLEELAARMRRLEQLMQRTLSFAKPLQLQRQVIDVQRLLEGAIASMSAELESSGATAESIVEPGGLHLVGDSHHLEEVLSNLVRNAIEAKGSGARIELHAAADGKGWMRILVDDDGPGIPNEMRADLFKPFITTKSQGTGLGLAICKKIVDEHGGTLTIEDAPRGGARFVLRLPTGL